MTKRRRKVPTGIKEQTEVVGELEAHVLKLYPYLTVLDIVIVLNRVQWRIIHRYKSLYIQENKPAEPN